MRPHVSLQTALARKRLATHTALERLFAGVSPDVRLEVADIAEQIAARRTLVGPLARVRAHVSLEVAHAREGAGAQVADVGPFARVRAYVLLQMAALAEVLLADAARERLLTRAVRVSESRLHQGTVALHHLGEVLLVDVYRCARQGVDAAATAAVAARSALFLAAWN